jgi:AAA15 family ATPase/GTPase
VIGENDTGKSNLLKMLYAVTQGLEDRARDPGEGSSWTEKISKKLRWTFQPKGLKLGGLVRKGADSLSVHVDFDFGTKEYVGFEFGSSTTKEVRSLGGSFKERTEERIDDPKSSLFFPPDEVLSTMKAIATTREQRKVIGFGDTYYDLITALRQPESYHERGAVLKEAEEGLDDMFPGKIRQLDDGTFEYRRGSSRFEMTQTADGFKKLGSLVHLLRNGVIQDDSILFLDEPETSLNPDRLLTFIEVLFTLAQSGVQLFIATHSYVVLKQLQLIARETDQRVPLCVLSRTDDGVTDEQVDIRERIPDNPIVQSSLELYKRDVAQKVKT